MKQARVESAENANGNAVASIEGLPVSYLKRLCTLQTTGIILPSFVRSMGHCDTCHADADMKEAHDLHTLDKEEASTSKVEDANGEAANP